jgi:hypothetical protein
MTLQLDHFVHGILLRISVPDICFSDLLPMVSHCGI